MPRCLASKCEIRQIHNTLVCGAADSFFIEISLLMPKYVKRWASACKCVTLIFALVRVCVCMYSTCNSCIAFSSLDFCCHIPPTYVCYWFRSRLWPTVQYCKWNRHLLHSHFSMANVIVSSHLHSPLYIFKYVYIPQIKYLCALSKVGICPLNFFIWSKTHIHLYICYAVVKNKKKR